MDDPTGLGALDGSLATRTLVQQAAAGDRQAENALCERLRPRLVAWTRGRLPGFARDLLETEDVVHEAIVSSLRHIEAFQESERGSFLGYVMRAIQNRIRSEIRRTRRRPGKAEVTDELVERGPTPIEALLDREAEDTYRRALEQLSEEEQEILLGRYELQMSFAELAIHTGRVSADAARMATNRATRTLAKLLASEEASGATADS